jgi:hypothetical protein
VSVGKTVAQHQIAQSEDSRRTISSAPCSSVRGDARRFSLVATLKLAHSDFRREMPRGGSFVALAPLVPELPSKSESPECGQPDPPLSRLPSRSCGSSALAAGQVNCHIRPERA